MLLTRLSLCSPRAPTLCVYKEEFICRTCLRIRHVSLLYSTPVYQLRAIRKRLSCSSHGGPRSLERSGGYSDESWPVSGFGT